MDNLEFLKQLLPNFDPLPGDIAQRSVQVASDRVLWAQLLDSSNLRDVARLNTQSGGKHTYAWLQAIPHPNLGLSMSSSEFSIALRYWLGIPLFRGSHLQSCTCRSPLDQHGDHLLGCGQGPLRIRRHDALCNIVYHALSQDNSSVRREERIWGDSRDRPGDIFHPDFDDGHPTYFAFLYVTRCNRAILTVLLRMLVQLLSLEKWKRIRNMRPMLSVSADISTLL